MKESVLKKVTAFFVLLAFMFAGIMPPRGFAQVAGLPQPGAMVTVTPAWTPVMMRGIRVRPDNPLIFDFLMDTGRSGLGLKSPAFRTESERLIKYFLATLAVKEDDIWVNLSPFEHDRVISRDLGRTELGRDMLEQDYVLKQLTASLIYPENGLGRTFWNEVYARAQQEFGTTDIPVDTFNKVWITADKARVLERNNTGYVVAAHLKVMLESDYLAAEHHSSPRRIIEPQDDVAKDVLRQVVIPVIEKEVNEGRNFAPLRQMFYGMILAAWYKQALKDALLNKVYSGQGKMRGIEDHDPAVQDRIYAQYMEAYKKGVFNYIREDKDLSGSGHIPRKYFSGGIDRGQAAHPEVSHKVMPGDDMRVQGDMAEVTVRMDRAFDEAPDKAQKISEEIVFERMPAGVNRRLAALKEWTSVYDRSGALLQKGISIDDYARYYIEVMTKTGWRMVGYSQGADFFASGKEIPTGKTVRFTGILKGEDQKKTDANIRDFLQEQARFKNAIEIRLESKRPVSSAEQGRIDFYKSKIANPDLRVTFSSTEYSGSTSIMKVIFDNLKDQGKVLPGENWDDLLKKTLFYQLEIWPSGRIPRRWDNRKDEDIEAVFSQKMSDVQGWVFFRAMNVPSDRTVAASKKAAAAPVKDQRHPPLSPSPISLQQPVEKDLSFSIVLQPYQTTEMVRDMLVRKIRAKTGRAADGEEGLKELLEGLESYRIIFWKNGKMTAVINSARLPEGSDIFAAWDQNIQMNDRMFFYGSLRKNAVNEPQQKALSVEKVLQAKVPVDKPLTLKDKKQEPDIPAKPSAVVYNAPVKPSLSQIKAKYPLFEPGQVIMRSFSSKYENGRTILEALIAKIGEDRLGGRPGESRKDEIGRAHV